MTEPSAQNWEAAIGAALARTGAGLRMASLALGVAGAGLGVALAQRGHVGGLLAFMFAAQALLTGAGLYLGLRVQFDAELFCELARKPDLPGFDAAMDALGLLPASKQGRAIAARVNGVKRLLKLQGAGVALQLVALFGLQFA